MAFLITTWYGCFLYNDQEKLEEKILFSKDEKKITTTFQNISKNMLLPEEKKIIKKHENIIVAQKRLQKIGSYQPQHPFFQTIQLDFQDYGYSKEFIHQITYEQANQKIQHLLQLPDHQIIQMVQAIDDLIQTSNLLMERITTWIVFPVSDESIEPFKALQKQTDTEIKRLQEIIKKQMEHLAPNTTKIVGPLIAARLIAHAGSMEKLAMLPASSIQLLGAEKALFRFKKEGGKPPKHGVIFQHSLISKAPHKLRGKYARILSLKIGLAIKADVFTKRDISKEIQDELQQKIKNCAQKNN